MKNSNKLGQYGEDLACFYLQEKGYQILHRNLMLGALEIDIVAQNKDLTCLIEVKVVSNKILGPAQDRLNHKKIKFMKKAAVLYSVKFRLKLDKISLEFIAIDIEYGVPKISHFNSII